MSTAKLRKVYAENGVRRKLVRRVKALPMRHQAEFENRKRQLKTLMRSLDRKDTKVVYLDEVVFSKQSLAKFEFFPKHVKVGLDENKVYVDYWCAIAAISKDKPVEHKVIVKSAVNEDIFMTFVKELRKKVKTKHLVLFMDNLPVHRRLRVKQFCDDNDIERVFNLPYCPQFNPIEAVFSIVKHNYKKQRLRALLNDIDFDIKVNIIRAFRTLGKRAVSRCIDHAKRELEE